MTSIVLARGSRTKAKKFSVRQMNGVIDDVVNKLHSAIRKQNPDVDADDLESDVRALVSKHGGNAPMESTASTTAPEYNLAGDVLCIAYEKFNAGDIQGCLTLCAAAMESDGISELVSALEETNAQTDVAFQALAAMADSHAMEEDAEDEPAEEDEDSEEVASDDDEDTDEDQDDNTDLDDDEYEDEDSEETSSDDEEDSDEDAEEDEPEDEHADLAATLDEDGDETDNDAEDDDDTGAEEEHDDEVAAAVAKITASFKSNKLTNQQRAIINKMSLNGKQEQRNLARAITK